VVDAGGLEEPFEVVFLRPRGLSAALLLVSHRHEVRVVALLVLLLLWSRGRSLDASSGLLLLPFARVAVEDGGDGLLSSGVVGREVEEPFRGLGLTAAELVDE
jgi:hypothetical protein